MNKLTKKNTFQIIEKARAHKKSPFNYLRKEGYAIQTSLIALKHYFADKPNQGVVLPSSI